MSNELTLPIKSFVKGRWWYLYSIDYETPDGQLGGYFYATSDAHAALLLSELKATATVSGRVMGVQDE